MKEELFDVAASHSAGSHDFIVNRAEGWGRRFIPDHSDELLHTGASLCRHSGLTCRGGSPIHGSGL